MTFEEYLIACGIVAGIPLMVVAAYKVGRYIALHDEPLPEYDWDGLQAEMDEEFAPLSRAHREEIAARLQ
ncbi:hypothetical protein AU381_00185 [Sinorhizobium glycinis]|uniref:Uncharacterized protein n=1 Tax=Sinorhizobium glycinis TaxID=1472378 RepID=A0A178XYR9_9HYPH|nr:hypothetical protein [Sinorhizobium glycinis]OAP40381.1 hypothetical protein AU381_00185 [Sinorhizobium glycinis]